MASFPPVNPLLGLFHNLERKRALGLLAAFSDDGGTYLLFRLALRTFSMVFNLIANASRGHPNRKRRRTATKKRKADILPSAFKIQKLTLTPRRSSLPSWQQAS